MKIGIVCPYSFDVDGGVQVHVRDLATELRRRGHDVQILAPGRSTFPGFTSAGKAIPVTFNGSVARLSLWPHGNRVVRQWLSEGAFDILHVHEPFNPSLSLAAIKQSRCPTVATFHSNIARSRTLQLSAPVLGDAFRKIDVCIAVSKEARRTVVDHYGGDAIIVPNGVNTTTFAHPVTDVMQGQGVPVFSFLGRLDEERKGAAVLAAAIPLVAGRLPAAKFYFAGRGDTGELQQSLRDQPVTFLGEVSESEKVSLLAGSTAYIAPQTGGESFGIVLIEAMAAGTAVIASDLRAFTDVMQSDGGLAFHTGDSRDLAEKMIRLAQDDRLRSSLVQRGLQRAAEFDWQNVTDKIELIYHTWLERR
ncbi:MAG: glycosyltransferase family 4 protein [Actinomycetaceae bacterium]|nr:glycosyltransferase family 4 protein [Actinomycetaceae bacterium]